MLLHPEQASRVVRFAQGVVGFGIVLLVGVLVWPPTAGAPPAAKERAMLPRRGGDARGPADWPKPDWASLGPLLEGLYNPAREPQDLDAAAAVAQDQAGLAAQQEDPDPVVPTGVPGWSYQGCIGAAGEKAALLTINGEQRFLYAGDTRDGWTVDTIDAKGVVVRGSGGVRRIDLSGQPRAAAPLTRGVPA